MDVKIGNVDEFRDDVHNASKALVDGYDVRWYDADGAENPE